MNGAAERLEGDSMRGLPNRAGGGTGNRVPLAHQFAIAYARLG